MKTLDLKLTRIGNSRGVRLPVGIINRYGFDGSLAAEVRQDGLLLKAKKKAKLSWRETYKQMAKSDEDWSDWEAVPAGTVEPWEGVSETAANGDRKSGPREALRHPLCPAGPS
ncbi:MAG: hypothetical protein DME25_05265 [Verrucomicrobia bacterium]|nr:MAG: hypothetical protein DME25_05265 [Verrucomicrobiota bacterium]